MAPAPRLPSVLDAPRPRASESPSFPAGRGAPEHRADDAPLGVLGASIVTQHQRVTELHQQFMRQQVAFYDQFHALLAASPAPAHRPAAPAAVERTLDLAIDTWLADHCPSWTLPVVPAMGIADLLAQAAAAYSGQEVFGVRDMQMRRWLTVPDRVRLRTVVEDRSTRPTVTLAVWHAARTAELSRFVAVASGQVLLGDPPRTRPTRFPPLADALPTPNPYTTVEMFHGPSFQHLLSLQTGSAGASGILDIGLGKIPRGVLHPGLLDAAMHTIPGGNLWRWSPELPRGRFGFPHRLASLTRFEPLPDAGTLAVEVRFAGFDEGNREMPILDLQLCQDERVLLAFRMVLILIPNGRFGDVPPARVRAFARDRQYVPECLLSTCEEDVTLLHRRMVSACDFVPGTVAALYGLPPRWRDQDPLALVAAKEHVARRLGVHPGSVEVYDDLSTGWCTARPHQRYPLALTCEGDTARVRDANPDTTRRAE